MQSIEQNDLIPQFYQAIVESSDDAIISKTLEGIVTSWNAAAEQIFGFTAEEMIGQPLLRIFPPGRVGEEARILEKVGRGEKVDHFRTVRRHKDGTAVQVSVTVSPIADADGRIVGVSSIARDLGERVRAESLLWRNENFDSLTGLPNRTFLLSLLEQELQVASSRNQRFAVLSVDIDNFRKVNDLFGHVAGDRLLVDMAHLISSCIRKSDTVARVGVDEFVLILPALSERQQVERLLATLEERLDWQLTHHGQTIHVSASVGVAMYPEHGQLVEDLLKRANQSISESRKGRRQRNSRAQPAAGDVVSSRNNTLHDLMSAIERRQVELLYQPVVDLADGSLFMAEALPMWMHPTRGPVMPDEFLPLVAEHRLAPVLGDWMANTLAEQAATWSVLPVDACRLGMVRLPGMAPADCDWREFPPGYLERLAGVDGAVIEISESLLLDNAESTRDELFAYHAAGLQVVVDDFGTGYSSLAYLQQFPIDMIRISGAFIRDVDKGTNRLHLCEAMVVMAHKLNLKVIAEGVENSRQLALLNEIGCDLVQGPAIAVPMRAGEFGNLLGAGSPLLALEAVESL